MTDQPKTPPKFDITAPVPIKTADPDSLELGRRLERDKITAKRTPDPAGQRASQIVGAAIIYTLGAALITFLAAGTIWAVRAILG